MMQSQTGVDWPQVQRGADQASTDFTASAAGDDGSEEEEERKLLDIKKVLRGYLDSLIEEQQRERAENGRDAKP